MASVLNSPSPVPLPSDGRGWPSGRVRVEAERNLRTHHEARLIAVEAVDHEVRKGVLRNVRRDARDFAGTNGLFADVLNGVVVHPRVHVDQVVSALALPGD